MKIHRYLLFGLTAGLSAFAVSSCAYDPYYSSSYGGYGNGYGYGNSSFSTSFFVSTGSSRWGYDPYAGCYYDYTRRAYYDPYLSGYYPVGYRPRYVSGAPHPHGWSRGSSYCPPPSSVRTYNLTNYQNRTDRYRNLGRDWSRNVRDVSHRDQRPQINNSREQRPSPFSRFQGGSSNWNNNSRDMRSNGRDNTRSGGNVFPSRDNGSRDSSRDRGNTTVTIPQQRPQGTRTGGTRTGGSLPNRGAIEELMRQRGGNTQRESKPSGVGRPTPQNHSGSGGGGQQRGNSGGSGRERGGERIRGIGEG